MAARLSGPRSVFDVPAATVRSSCHWCKHQTGICMQCHRSVSLQATLQSPTLTHTHAHNSHWQTDTRSYSAVLGPHGSFKESSPSVCRPAWSEISEQTCHFQKTGKLASVFILSPFCSVIKVKNTFYWQLFLLFDQTKAYLFQSQINTKKYLSFFEEYLGF